MANHYLQFSEIIDNVTKEEATWARTRLQEMTEKFIEDPEEGWYFEFAIHEEAHGDDDEGAEGPHIWLYADEGGEPEHVVQFVKEFLRKFRPDGSFYLSWAAWCDKLRVGQFGGGAVFVTAEIEKWCQPFDFIDDERKKFDKAADKKK